MNTKLTKAQQERFAKVEAKLPAGFSYSLHDEDAAPKYYAKKVWGVTVWNGDNNSMGHVQNNMSGYTTCDAEHVALVRLLLNRAAAALWHKQPVWEG